MEEIEKGIGGSEELTTIELGDPAQELSGTARRILEAARGLLAREGFAAVSVSAVAKAAGEYKSTVTYHFGDKAGLITAITDSMLDDLSLSATLTVRKGESRSKRLKVLQGFQREVARDAEYWRTFYDLMPHIIRDRRLRARFAALLDGYCRQIVEVLELGDKEDVHGEARVLASLVLSVLEGTALQRQLMGPRGVDVDANFRLMGRLLEPHLNRWG